MTTAPGATIRARLKAGEPLANRILRVDHGGEQGAVHIYKAQALICSWRTPGLTAQLREFQSHEERHRRILADELEIRRIRQGLGYHLCALGGFTLGLVTALIGPSAIASTTRAVERVVLRHLNEQMDYLRSADQSAYCAVESIIADEQRHHDLASVGSKGLWPIIVDPVVAALTEFVIWIGMHR